MIEFKRRIAAKLAVHLPGIEEQALAAWLEYPANPEMGDLSLPCFRLAKTLRRSPQAIAEQLKAELQDETIGRVDAVSGYLNVYFDQTRLAESVMRAILERGDRYGSQNIGQGKTVVIDYSSPNIAKPFHVAHLRSTVIGHALVQILSFLGYRCVGINHLGDWGTQFGKLIVAYRKWGAPERVAEDGIDELLRLYVRFHQEADNDPALEDEARAWFVKLEQGDDEALGLWRRFVEISMAEFQKIYDLLGVRFDSYAGESFYNDKMDAVIQELKDKRLLEEDNGAWIVRLDDYGMPPALMLKRDGSSLYHTRDVAAALYRKKTYDFDRAIYVTDYAQNLHFSQWFKIVELMGHAWASDLVHVAFGRVSIEGMSLSTRKGNVIKLEDVLMQAIRKTREIIEARNPELEQKDEVARQVGVGAIVFNDLKGNRMADVNFSWDEALQFEGETGPYVQYTHARICSVLRKAGEASAGAAEPGGIDALLLTHPQEQELIKTLAQFPERVEQAMRKLEPSIVTRYLVDVAQAFNRFYRECRILTDDDGVSGARLALARCARITLRNGLRLIGLAAPDRM